ncbi:fungal protein [Schizosaccharomyces japonicus yFS275]|uniref:Fungal protein n=1 Tax=Schizosaccharomyces japonicus (strain yFS275 / FY16936) TaxID=402676 RepID=B6K4I0_SCHJY|nr:fungal protein [Schizosaccharomyces japonicus yFS275]EEB08387.1 fungal protein [Schizosaccharomyces japonicus yFS275]
MDLTRDKIHILGSFCDTFRDMHTPCSLISYRAYFITTENFFCESVSARFVGKKIFPTDSKYPMEVSFNTIEWSLAHNITLKEGEIYSYNLIAELPPDTPRTISTDYGSISYCITVEIATDFPCRIPKTHSVDVIVPFTLNPDRLIGSHDIRFGYPLCDKAFQEVTCSLKHFPLSLQVRYPEKCYKGPQCICPVYVALKSAQNNFQNLEPDGASRYWVSIYLVQEITFLLFQNTFRTSPTILYEEGRWTPPPVAGHSATVEFIVPIEDEIHGSCNENPHVNVKHYIYVAVNDHVTPKTTTLAAFTPESLKKSRSFFYRRKDEGCHFKQNLLQRLQFLNTLDCKIPVSLFHRKLESELSHLPPYSPTKKDPYCYYEDDEDGPEDVMQSTQPDPPLSHDLTLKQDDTS